MHKTIYSLVDQIMWFVMNDFPPMCTLTVPLLTNKPWCSCALRSCRWYRSAGFSLNEANELPTWVYVQGHRHPPTTDDAPAIGKHQNNSASSKSEQHQGFHGVGCKSVTTLHLTFLFVPLNKTIMQWESNLFGLVVNMSVHGHIYFFLIIPPLPPTPSAFIWHAVLFSPASSSKVVLLFLAADGHVWYSIL